MSSLLLQQAQLPALQDFRAPLSSHTPARNVLICTCQRLCRRKSSSAPYRPRKRQQAVSASAQTAVQLPETLQKIVTLFKVVPNPKLKYQQLLAYAKELPLLPADLHTEDHKVRGCVSQVWVVGQLDSQGNLTWRADSDSALTKGLAALLVQGLTGCSPETVIRLDPEWISQMGLQQSLTPSRNNGFLNMFKLMQQKSLQLLMARDRGVQSGEASASAAPSPSPAEAASAGGSPSEAPQSTVAASAAPSQPSVSAPAQPAVSSNGCGTYPASSSSSTPVRDSMHAKIKTALSPSELDIIDESSQHAGHAAMRHGHAGAGGETHFRILVTSSDFEGLNTMKRHRLIYQLLKDELAGSVHALSLVTRAPSEAN